MSGLFFWGLGWTIEYLLRFVFCFSFPPERIYFWKTTVMSGIPRRSWGPRLIAGTSGESWENSRGTWGPSLSNVHVATLNCHCVCCLGAKDVGIFQRFPKLPGQFWGDAVHGDPVRNQRFTNLSAPRVSFLLITPSGYGFITSDIFPQAPPSFFYCLYPFSPGSRISALTQLSLDQYQLWKITCWTHWQGTNGWSGQISKGGLQFSGSRKYMPIEFKHPRATGKCVGTVESLSILSARGMVIPGFACLEGQKPPSHTW